MLKKVLAFADGENLVFRYQELLAQGKLPKPDVVHVKNQFVWHPKVTTWSMFDLIRVSYYTSMVGDDVAHLALESRISDTWFECRGIDIIGGAALIPKVHRKSARSKKTKVVDVDITIDVMRALAMPVDGILLLSGDGDYLPLIREATRSSKQIYLGAFSSGLAPSLKNSVDIFVDLDDFFFVSPPVVTIQRST
jgi:uncharacterized LabA/DUF88 family protein